MTRYRIPRGILRAHVEGEEVLLNQDSGVYHLVNATGSSILRSFEAGSTLESAIETLARESGQSQERVTTDASAFVHAMVERGLLEPMPDSE